MCASTGPGTGPCPLGLWSHHCSFFEDVYVVSTAPFPTAPCLLFAAHASSGHACVSTGVSLFPVCFASEATSLVVTTS